METTETLENGDVSWQTWVMKTPADTRLARVLLVSFSCEEYSMLILVYIHFYRDTMKILSSQRHSLENIYNRLLASWMLTSLSLSCAHDHCSCEAVASLCKSLQKDGTCLQAGRSFGSLEEKKQESNMGTRDHRLCSIFSSL